MSLHFDEKELIEKIGDTSSTLKINREESKKMTGYASIDKPWLKYYDKEKLEKPLPKMTIYDYLKQESVMHPNQTAINYYGNKISYQKLIEKKIVDVVKAYTKLGIKKGDRVAFLMPNLPETAYSFYALSMLGAIGCYIDPRAGNERIKKQLKETKANVLVTIDLACPKVDKIADETELDRIIAVPATNSLPFGMNYVIEGKKAIKEFLRKLPTYSGYQKWNDFVNKGKNVEPNIATYTEKSPVAIVFTSGTTGDPTGVVISNDGLNAVAHEYKISGVSHEIGDKFLNIMPPFLLYGLVCGLHMPLCLGMEDIIYPQVKGFEFGKLVMKHKPQHFMVNQDYYDGMVNYDKMEGRSLSFLISAGIGGSAITPNQEKNDKKFLRDHDCLMQLAKGYGATQGGGPLVAAISNETDIFRGAGIPLPCTEIGIFEYSLDENNEIIRTDKELPYNTVGEICATGPTLMKEYLNNPELTKKDLRLHSDGKVWLHTADYGSIDENGQVFVGERINRVITRPDSHCVSLPSIEKIINSHPQVLECAVVGVKPKKDENGKLPKAVIVIDKDYVSRKYEIVQELIDMCANELPERDVAYFYEIVDKLPLSLAGKTDYKKLEMETIGELINANIKISDLVSEKTLKFGTLF